MMEINNFDILDKWLKFQKGSYYKFECLVRNTDGYNPMYQEGYSKTNKNILIKSWYVDSKAYYNKIKQEMITLCDITGGRLYITCDRKSVKKTIMLIFDRFSNYVFDLANGGKFEIKSVAKAFASCTSDVLSSDKKTRTLMFDIDTQDQLYLCLVFDYLTGKGLQLDKDYIVLMTKKGYHVVCYRTFDVRDWGVENIGDYIDVKPNQLGLVYMNSGED